MSSTNVLIPNSSSKYREKSDLNSTNLQKDKSEDKPTGFQRSQKLKKQLKFNNKR